MATLKHSYALNSAVALSLNTLHSSLSRYTAHDGFSNHTNTLSIHSPINESPFNPKPYLDDGIRRSLLSVYFGDAIFNSLFPVSGRRFACAALENRQTSACAKSRRHISWVRVCDDDDEQPTTRRVEVFDGAAQRRRPGTHASKPRRRPSLVPTTARGGPIPSPPPQ